MSTIPFIQVEGAIALPRMRPLDRFPVTFGREWTLTPPHFSLSAEIRALYAAIMRTVCLSAEAFREACRWDRQRHFFPAPSAAPVRPSVTVSAGANEPPARTKTLPPAHAAHTAALRPVPSSSGTHKLAGGACAIGGAALLAWIMASHTPHGEHKATVPDAPPIRAAGDTASQRLADMRTAHDDTAAPAHASSQRAAGDMLNTSRGIEATHPSARHATSTDASAVAASSGARSSTSEPGYAAANHPVVSPRAALSGSAARAHMVSGPRVESSRHHARALAPSVEAHRTPGTYPQASDYSPRQPSTGQNDDYASINTFAATFAAPRPANRPSLPVDSTDWVNHVSQRRVTEVPDRFGQ